MKLIFFILFTLTADLYAQAYRKNLKFLPKLELGFGAGYASTPAYPGSSGSTEVFAPFPAILYRGDVLRSDEDGGIRTRIYNSKRLELNMSVGGSLPASTDDTPERIGMPSLDAVLELGPGLIYHFLGTNKGDNFKLSISIPIRFAFSTDFKDTEERGLVFHPILFSFWEITDRWILFSSLSARWGTKNHNEYFYEVEERFSRADRPEYQAQSGHVLYAPSLGLIYNQAIDYTLFAGVAYESYQDNANKDSPLFRKKENISWGAGFTWWFYASDY